MDLINVKVYSDKDFPPYLPKLNSIYDDLFSGGKGLRSRLIQLTTKYLSLTEKKVLLLAQTIEFIHNASLLHDDLIDRSHLRRNKTTAWLKYTPEYAVLAGDYLLARVMVNLSKNGNIRLVQYTSEVISDLLEGEWIQDSLIKDHNVDLDALDRVHNLKTSSLFKWSLRAPFYCSENYDENLHHHLEEMGAIMGQLFQRSDDLLDFNIRNEEKKAVLGDLKSGYLNSFSAFLMRNASEAQRSEFMKCQVMGEVYTLLGEKNFFAAVDEFDNINTSLIELFDHHLHRLEGFLKESQMGLIKELRTVSQKLYWRRT